MLARQVDGLAQLVEQDGGRAAAEVQRLEAPAALSKHEHLGAQVLEVAPREILAVDVAVEAAVGAEHLAEGNMQVEHVVFAFVRGGEELLFGRAQV